MSSINGIYNSSAIGQLLETTFNPTGKELSESTSSILYNSSYTSVSISAFGSQINSIYNNLKTISDSEDRQAALDGLRGALLDIASNPSDGDLFSFISTANSVSDADASAFQAVFGVNEPEPYSAEAMDAGPKGYVDRYGAVSNSSISAQYSETALSIITGSGTSEQKQNAIEALLSKSNELLSSDMSQEQLAKVAEEFFSGVQQLSLPTEIVNYIDEFEVTLEEESSQANTLIEQAQNLSNTSGLYDKIQLSPISEDFRNAGLNIIMAANETNEARNTAYNALLITSANMLEAGLSDEKLQTESARFFTGLEQQTTLEEKIEYMANFELDVEQ